jgi:hypothetical protein
MSTKLRSAGLFLGCILIAGPAPAALFTYSWLPGEGGDDVSVSHGVGSFRSVYASYDTDTGHLLWEATFDRNGEMLPDGGWLVLSPGPNPKANLHEYAILYMDAGSGRATSYIYDGTNSSNSWIDPNMYLGSHASAVNVDDVGDTRKLSLWLDASGINTAYDDEHWLGTGFHELMGAWFHPVYGLAIDYVEDGRIADWGFLAQGHFDSNGLVTVQAPEPSAGLIFALGSLVIGAGVRRQGR